MQGDSLATPGPSGPLPPTHSRGPGELGGAVLQKCAFALKRVTDVRPVCRQFSASLQQLRRRADRLKAAASPRMKCIRTPAGSSWGEAHTAVS